MLWFFLRELNKKEYMKKIVLAFIITILTISKGYSQYSMKLENIEQTNDSTIVFDVYINGSANFRLTSYQCALTFNQYITDGKISFGYVKGSSQLSTTPPNFGIGVNNSDGFPKLTFASMPGADKLSRNNLRMGSFKIHTSTKFTTSQPNLNWSFDGNIKTIVTGKDFSDDTDSSNHTWISSGTLPVVKIKTSSSTSTVPVDYLLDGVGSNTSTQNTYWSTDKMPAYLIFDLGQLSNISHTKFSFAGWNNDKVFHYSISFSSDTTNWNTIVYDAPSAKTEFTSDNFHGITARYVKLDILDNNQDNTAGLWEAQIVGSTDSSEIQKGQRFDPGVQNPNEFTLLQNYPNPFNPSTKISFNLKESGKVDLEIYNVLGQKVATLIDQEMIRGYHEVTFNGSSLASGIYVYRLAVDDKFSAVKKMMLLK